MKALLACWIAACLPLFAGSLTFEETTRSVVVDDDKKTLTVDFPFVNKGDSDAIIERYDAGCPCATVGVKDSKLAYKPGESGTVRIVFDMGLIPGTVDKVVALFLKGDPSSNPSVKLTTRITIPALVEVEPKSLIWEVGSKPEPKTVTVTMKHTEPIRILSVSGADARFSQELKTIEEGKKYEIVVTPASTEKVGMGVIHMETDCKRDRHRSHRVFTVVRKPVAKQAAAATTP
jgi:hypothetical protein